MLTSVLLVAANALLAGESGQLASRIAQERGRVVVVNFWAVWCEPCKREMPMLAKVARDYAARDVTFLGASIDDQEEIEKAKAFARKKGVSYPLVFGVTPAEMIAFRLGDAVPVTVILDREGAPRFRLVGELKERDIRQRLDSLLEPGVRQVLEELLLPEGMTVEHFKSDHENGESAEHQLEEQKAREESGSAVPG